MDYITSHLSGSTIAEVVNYLIVVVSFLTSPPWLKNYVSVLNTNIFNSVKQFKQIQRLKAEVKAYFPGIINDLAPATKYDVGLKAMPLFCYFVKKEYSSTTSPNQTRPQSRYSSHL
jgi:hypothetical protein